MKLLKHTLLVSVATAYAEKNANCRKKPKRMPKFVQLIVQAGTIVLKKTPNI